MAEHRTAAGGMETKQLVIVCAVHDARSIDTQAIVARSMQTHAIVGLCPTSPLRHFNKRETWLR